MIKVKFLSILKQYCPKIDDNGFWKIPFKENLSIEDVLNNSSISKTEIKYSILVNGRRKTIDYILEDNDILTIMPLLAGG